MAEWLNGGNGYLPTIFMVHADNNDDDDDNDTNTIKSFIVQAEGGFAAGAVLFDLGGNGVFWQKKGVTLRGLRISEKKEILRKLTVFNDGGNSNCRCCCCIVSQASEGHLY
jgi:hypothetical protein